VDVIESILTHFAEDAGGEVTQRAAIMLSKVRTLGVEKVKPQYEHIYQRLNGRLVERLPTQEYLSVLPSEGSLTMYMDSISRSLACERHP
jgi:hypothetical protein